MERMMSWRLLLVATVLLAFSPACSKRGTYLNRTPAIAEVAGEWRSGDRIPGGKGGEMSIVLRDDKSCEIVEVPIYDETIRAYRIHSGRGQWFFSASIHTKQGARVIVAPALSKFTAALEVMEANGRIVLQYATDPESPSVASFTRK
jgi:hypothetical protein